MPPNTPLLISVPILLLAAGVSAWALYERNPMSAPVTDRPVPIRDAFKSVGAAIAFAGTVLTMLVGWQVIDQAQADATTNLLGLIPGAITAVTTVLMAFGVRAQAEPKVTPVEKPQDPAGRPLVAAPLVREGGQTRVVGDGDGIGEHRAE